jgi:hypothetical protein
MLKSVNERVSAIATFRFIEVRLMELVAGWTPSAPEMEVKVLFGRHIWAFAQHADALGKRTFELRRPEQFSLRPIHDYVSLLDEVSRIDSTPERIATLYDAILPGLRKRYERYIAETDPMLDEPSVVIIERILVDLDRLQRECAALRAELGFPALAVGNFVESESSIASVVAAEGNAS